MKESGREGEGEAGWVVGEVGSEEGSGLKRGGAGGGVSLDFFG